MVGPWRCSRRGKRSYGGPASRWSRCVAHEVTAGKDNFMDEQGQERALRDYVGRNDKTKVIAKLQRRGGGKLTAWCFEFVNCVRRCSRWGAACR
mmetsp:Transcript_64872/g.174118  ORF Transcript_64872/g.174118 Transcript_64872/m.174118 type:complete len:94 (+) Transcript_64872:748-1029(+)